VSININAASIVRRMHFIMKCLLFFVCVTFKNIFCAFILPDINV
jgi:hypothetical protein